MTLNRTIKWPGSAVHLNAVSPLLVLTSVLSVATMAVCFPQDLHTEPDCPHNYTEILEELLHNYDKRLRPDYGGPPVEVKVGLYVENIFSINEAKMEISMTLFVRQLWLDPRLTFDGKNVLVLKGEDIEFFWSPDPFFLYEIKAWTHEVTIQNKALYIYPNGEMFKSQRLSVIVGCNMKLHQFPLDDQTCSLQLMSYAYTSEHLTLIIPPGEVKLDPNITIPAFHLTHFEISEIDKKQYALGYYSCVGIIFHFKRYWQAYMLTVYLPSYLLVIISWLSFFIDSKSAPARVSLGVTTVLTMTTLTTSVLNSLPQVTYTKSIDIWLAACLVFIFAALVEYAVASQLNCNEDHQRHKKQEQLWKSSLFELHNYPINGSKIDPSRESSDGDIKLDLESAVESETKKENDVMPLWLVPTIKHGLSTWCTSRHLDFHSRWIYFLAFLSFNIAYWLISF